MSEVRKKIERALISVYNKEGLEELVKELDKRGVEIISTGGTQEFIKSLGVNSTSVEDLTDYPSILGGRVKTLHPTIFGGILARREEPEDQKQCDMYDIRPIDLVVVDLYPFEETVAEGGSHAEIIEKIDIGGVSLIRAAAKNYKDVLVVPSRKYYSHILDIISKEAGTTEGERATMARRAFKVTHAYDSAIYSYFCQTDDIAEPLRLMVGGKRDLRYGENPHQKAVFYGEEFAQRFTQLHGKELSYNNLLDIDAAVQLIAELEAPSAVVLKHNTPCGVASSNDVYTAYCKALEGDPISAFGGIIAVNREVDRQVAEKIGEIFFEVLIAPSYTKEAVEALTVKRNRILLVDKGGSKQGGLSYRSVVGGMLVQERDTITENPENWVLVSGTALSEAQTNDLKFGMTVVKYCKSNAIVLVKDGQVLGAGYGQTSRVDALNQAIEKAKTLGFSLEGASLASDAFFPFSDCVELAHLAGITSIIQPGGSIRDSESTELAEKYNISMVHSGIRHFRH